MLSAFEQICLSFSGLYFRGNELRLQRFRFKYDMRKFYFTNRVVDHWNSLPNWVASANNIITFKKDLISIGNIKK